MWNNSYREELLKKREAARNGGGKKRLEKQHEKGKLSARERLSILFDEGTFVEVDNLIEACVDMVLGFFSFVYSLQVAGSMLEDMEKAIGQS